ncbi:MAG: hypothetical protein ABL909_10725 [Sphingopyxis sp.]
MKSLIAIAAALSLASPTIAQAQSFDDHSYGRNESRIAIGVSVPFGQHRRDRDRDWAPRIDLRLDRAQIDASGARHANGLGSLRLSRTMGREPAWLVNNRRIALVDERRGVSTLGIIGITVGAVLVVGVIAVAVDPPLNNLFER